MDYIQRLPFISGAVMAIVIGAISYVSDVEDKVLYLRMAISLIAFYIVGMYVRSVLEKILEEIDEKKKEEMRQAEEENDKKHKEEQQLKNADENKQENAATIDYKVDGSEEFEPLKVGKVIKQKLKE